MSKLYICFLYFRCHITEVAAEIDRILRPGRWFVLHDTTEVIRKMDPVLRSLHYKTTVVQQQFLVATKGFWRPDSTGSHSWLFSSVPDGAIRSWVQPKPCWFFWFLLYWSSHSIDDQRTDRSCISWWVSKFHFSPLTIFEMFWPCEFMFGTANRLNQSVSPNSSARWI